MKPRTYITLLSTAAMLVGLYLGLHTITVESPMNPVLSTPEYVDCGPAIHPDTQSARSEEGRIRGAHIFGRAPSSAVGVSVVTRCEEAGSVERVLFWLLLALGAAGVIGAQFVRVPRQSEDSRSSSPTA